MVTDCRSGVNRGVVLALLSKLCKMKSNCQKPVLLLACSSSTTCIFKTTNTTAGTVNHLRAKSNCNKLQQMLRTRALSSRLRNCFKMFGCVWFWGRELMSCLHKSQEMGTTYYSYPRLFELKTEAHRKKANMATAQWDITQCQWLAVFFPSNFSFFPRLGFFSSLPLSRSLGMPHIPLCLLMLSPPCGSTAWLSQSRY